MSEHCISSGGSGADVILAQLHQAILKQYPDRLAALLQRLSKYEVYTECEKGRGRMSAKVLAVLLQTSSKHTLQAVARLAEAMLANQHLRSRRMFCFAYRRRSSVLVETIENAILQSFEVDSGRHPDTGSMSDIEVKRAHRLPADPRPKAAKGMTTVRWDQLGIAPTGFLAELQQKATAVANRVLSGVAPAVDSEMQRFNMPLKIVERPADRPSSVYSAASIFEAGSPGSQAASSGSSRKSSSHNMMTPLSPASPSVGSPRLMFTPDASPGDTRSLPRRTSIMDSEMGLSTEPSPMSAVSGPPRYRGESGSNARNGLSLLKAFDSAAHRVRVVESEVVVVDSGLLSRCARCVEVCVRLEHWAMNFQDGGSHKPSPGNETHQDKYRIHHGIIGSCIPSVLAACAKSVLNVGRHTRRPDKAVGADNDERLLKATLGSLLAVLYPSGAREVGSRPSIGSLEAERLRRVASTVYDHLSTSPAVSWRTTMLGRACEGGAQKTGGDAGGGAKLPIAAGGGGSAVEHDPSDVDADTGRLLHGVLEVCCRLLRI